jgi:hypothetical protein
MFALDVVRPVADMFLFGVVLVSMTGYIQGWQRKVRLPHLLIASGLGSLAFLA